MTDRDYLLDHTHESDLLLLHDDVHEYEDDQGYCDDHGYDDVHGYGDDHYHGGGDDADGHESCNLSTSLSLTASGLEIIQ